MDQEKYEQVDEEISLSELFAPNLLTEDPEEPPQEQPDEPSVPEEEPAKAKPTRKRILLGVATAITAAALTVGAVFLFRPDNSPEPMPVPDDGFYLLTKATEYNADGSPGFSQIIYTYDSRGFLLRRSKDEGKRQEVWNDDEDFYEDVFSSFDGKVDSIREYVYNENGDILYQTSTLNTYDADGNLLYASVSCDEQYQNSQYHYSSDGTIQSVDTYDTSLNQNSGILMYTLSHHYDDAGRLLEIFRKSQYDINSYLYDYRYDESGRLSLSSKRIVEGLYYNQYEYDDAGRLLRVTLRYGGNYQIAYIDGCINTIEYSYPANTQFEGQAVFTYNEGGQLINRSVYDASVDLEVRTDCEYENGQLSKVIYREGDSVTVYRFADEGNGKDITLVRDVNGNIIRRIRPDGSYTEYEYQRFDLSDEDIQRAKNFRYYFNRVDCMGYKHGLTMPSFSGGYAALTDVSYPVTDLYEIDLFYSE